MLGWTESRPVQAYRCDYLLHPFTMASDPQAGSSTDPQGLLEAFRVHYQHYNQAVEEAVSSPRDDHVLARLGADLDEFAGLVEEVSDVL